MVPDDFLTFFAASAAVAGALVGLLFVAISVAPEPVDRTARVQTDVRAGIAFSSLVNALSISLFALIPGTDLGTVAIAVGLASMSSCIALAVFLMREGSPGQPRRSQLRRLAIQVGLFGYQVVIGILLRGSARDRADVNTLAVLTVVLFLVGIARAWQLIGARDSGLLNEVGVALRNRGHEPPDDPSASPVSGD